MNENDRMIAILQTVIDIEKKFGNGSITTLDSAPRIFDSISSGFGSIDVALGGGYPKGRVIEIYGPESSGKVTLALHAIFEVQRNGGAAAFIDAEHSLDLDYARAIGVDFSKLLVSQPDNGEQALEICETLTRCGSVDLIVIDSVSGLIPKDEIDGDALDPYMGKSATMFSQALRKLAGIAQRTNTAIIFINHLRGLNGRTTYGNALKFYSSVRVDVRMIDRIKSDGIYVGFRSRAAVTKNKMAPPFKDSLFDVMNGFRCTCGRSLPREVQDNCVSITCLCGATWKIVTSAKLCPPGCNGSNCHCQNCGESGVLLDENSYCVECSSQKECSRCKSSFTLSDIGASRGHDLCGECSFAECGRCGSEMSSADDAECMSEKCVAFRKYADESANDPEG